jgi:DNA-binding transcriptional LysR family regulator
VKQPTLTVQIAALEETLGDHYFLSANAMAW